MHETDVAFAGLTSQSAQIVSWRTHVCVRDQQVLVFGKLGYMGKIVHLGVQTHTAGTHALLQDGSRASVRLVVNAEDSDDHFSRYVYALSPLGRLVGVAAASELAAVPRGRRVADVIRPPLFTAADTGLDALREFFEAHPIAAVPVVDQRGRLLGVVCLSDLMDYVRLVSRLGGHA